MIFRSLFRSRNITAFTKSRPNNAFFLTSKPTLCFTAPAAASYSTTPRLLMPLKQVEIFTLGDSNNNSNNNEGQLIATPAVIGSFVEAGDVVGIVQTDDHKKYEIPSPSTGRLVEIHAPLQSKVRVGDTLVTIDTDAVPQSSTVSPEQQALLQHIQQNGGTMAPEYLEQIVNETTDVETLRALAALLSDQFPPLRPNALTLLERVLELQKDDNLSDNEHTLNQATTHTDLGILLYRLGDLKAALIQLECALELRKVALGDKHPELSATYIHMGAMHNHLNNHDAGYDCFEKALVIQKDHLGEEHPLVAASLNNLGAMCYHKGDYVKAIPHYEQALQIYLKQPEGATSTDTAGSYNNLAVAMKHTGQTKEAIEYCRKALTIRTETLGENHPDTAISHVCLGQIYAESRQLEAAVEQFDQALKIQSSPDNQTNTLGTHFGTTHNHKGALYYEHGMWEQAKESYQNGLNAFQEALGDEAPQNADCWNNVGLAQQRLGEWDEALESHRSAQTILEKRFGKDHPTLAMTYANIASVYKAQKNYADALDYYQQSHSMLEKTLGYRHDMVGSSYNNIGQVLALQGQLDNALLQYKAALEIFQEALSPTHVYTGSLHYNIGLVHQQLEQTDESMESYQKAYDIWHEALGDEHPQTNLAEQAMDQLKKIAKAAGSSSSNEEKKEEGKSS